MKNKIFLPTTQEPPIYVTLSSKFLTKKNRTIVLLLIDDFLYRKSEKSLKVTPLDSSLRFTVKHEQTSFILRLEKDDINPIEYIFLDKSESWERRLKSRLPQLDYQTYYELEKLIGSGSFASVYIARRKHDGTKIAVKAFLKKMLIQKDPTSWRTSIDNEIQVMKSLDHPSLLKFYDHFENKAQRYMMIELARGGTLETALKRLEEPLPFLTVKVIFRQIVEAIKHMHEKGFMHRDLKPSNILLKKPMALKQFSLITQLEPNIVISDFGVSSQIKGNMDVGRYCGSPGFMAPEIYECEFNQNATYNEKCDIFSLGCILYRLITNKPLFNGVNQLTLKQQNRECILDWTKISEELYNSKSMTNLLMKILNKDSSQRPSCEEILNAKILYVEYDDLGCPLFVDYRKPKSSSIQVKPIKTARNSLKTNSNCNLPQLSPNVKKNQSSHQIAPKYPNRRSGHLLLPPINNRLQTEQS